MDNGDVTMRKCKECKEKFDERDEPDLIRKCDDCTDIFFGGRCVYYYICSECWDTHHHNIEDDGDRSDYYYEVYRDNR